MREDEGQFLTLKHYKTPLKSVPKQIGYGYYGAIQVTIDGKKIQCHLCGKLFYSLYMHILHTHKISAKEYKEEFDLSRTTSLISESERLRIREKSMKYFESMTDEQISQFNKKKKEGFDKWMKEKKLINNWQYRLETKNKNGTCPQQLLNKILEVKKTLGHTPSLAEFVEETGGQRYKHLIFKVYGSWLNALERIKLVPYERKTTIGKRYRKYEGEELLDLLRLFYQENNRVPTSSDQKRGLLPGESVYIRVFGSFTKAKELAGIPVTTRWLRNGCRKLSTLPKWNTR